MDFGRSPPFQSSKALASSSSGSKVLWVPIDCTGGGGSGKLVCVLIGMMVQEPGGLRDMGGFFLFENFNFFVERRLDFRGSLDLSMENTRDGGDGFSRLFCNASKESRIVFQEVFSIPLAEGSDMRYRFHCVTLRSKRSSVWEYVLCVNMR